MNFLPYCPNSFFQTDLFDHFCQSMTPGDARTEAANVWGQSEMKMRSLLDLRPIKVPPHRSQLHQHLQGLAGVQ